VVGSDHVARFLLGLIRKQPGAQIAPVETSDGLSFVIRTDGAIDSVMLLGARSSGDGERITDVWMMRNPEKLRQWG